MQHLSCLAELRDIAAITGDHIVAVRSQRVTLAVGV